MNPESQSKIELEVEQQFESRTESTREFDPKFEYESKVDSTSLQIEVFIPKQHQLHDPKLSITHMPATAAFVSTHIFGIVGVLSLSSPSRNFSLALFQNSRSSFLQQKKNTKQVFFGRVVRLSCSTAFLPVAYDVLWSPHRVGGPSKHYMSLLSVCAASFHTAVGGSLKLLNSPFARYSWRAMDSPPCRRTGQRITSDIGSHSTLAASCHPIRGSTRSITSPFISNTDRETGSSGSWGPKFELRFLIFPMWFHDKIFEVWVQLKELAWLYFLVLLGFLLIVLISAHIAYIMSFLLSFITFEP